MTLVRCGLVQIALKRETTDDIPIIRNAMLDSHEEYAEKAAREGVNVLSFQEIFNQPYFPLSRDIRWYASAERIPDGPTITRCQDWAKRYGLVIIAPIYEEEAPGVYYNTAAIIDAGAHT